MNPVLHLVLDTALQSANEFSGTLGVLNLTAAGGSLTALGRVTLSSEKGFSVSGGPATGAGGSSNLQALSDIDISTVSGATRALRITDSALQMIGAERAKLGAIQSRFETAVNNLQVTAENLSASRSRILDVDFATETASLSRAQILQQASTAMVAQANQLPQGVLALLR